MSSKIIIQKSPTRVDLAGGTLDLWPLFNFVDGAVTVNVAIDIYTTATLTPLDGKKIELVSDDLQFEKSFSNLDECLNDQDQKLELLKAQLRFWKPQNGFRLQTKSDSPVGGGLGGSSSLTISLLKAFNQFCGGKLTETHQLVRVAHNIEAKVLNTPTGTQDYYPAASGGINILDYSSTGIEQTVLSRATQELADHFMLVYTGKAHHSGLNNFEVLSRAVKKDPQVLTALRELKKIAQDTAKAVQASKWNLLPELFKQEFKWRIQLAEAFSSPEIDKLAEVSLQAGAEAVKICGAGGGGCVLVWVAPAKRQGVKDACQNAGFQVLPAKPVPPLV
jgi:D-glycero-alpha-D-manno-heptose-7-phosphate kinase